MQPVNLRSFRQRVRYHKKAFKRFLTGIAKNPPRGLDKLTAELEKEVWKETDCLSCANCCKKMTPTYTKQDIKRIAGHFSLNSDEFKKKWLRKDRAGDWLNRSLPCQFLNTDDNKCSIYEIRPLDCSGFPHLPKKKMVDYMHIHKQNLEYCPATYRMVEMIQERVVGHSS